MNPLVHPVTVLRASSDGNSAHRPDLVAVEEPLEIRLVFGPVSDRQQQALAVTMRTPGHDVELGLGFLFSETIIRSADDVLAVRHCRDADGQPAENILRIELKPEVQFDSARLQRNFYMTSSCGVCGKAALHAVAIEAQPCRSEVSITKEHLLLLPDQLRVAQAVFQHTGGLHAIGLFAPGGTLHLAREDVGRHNAMDKMVGAALRQHVPLSEAVCLLSGRASFELLQKAAVAGIPIVAAIGAPSSLAVEIAEAMGITLVGFLRAQSFNVYTHPHRIS